MRRFFPLILSTNSMSDHEEILSISHCEEMDGVLSKSRDILAL